MGGYTIGDVCRLLQVRAHVLRYWEREIPILSPRKDDFGRRVYTEADIDELRENAKSVGVPISGFLNKPFSLDDAVTCLKKALAA